MQKAEASFSMLAMSIASSALMAMGLSPNQENKTEVDRHLARFNIDLLLMLKDKTKTNLTEEEKSFLEHVIQDLQMKFVQLK